MSTIYGVFNRNGTPTPYLAAIREAIAYWEADNASEWIEGTVALGHRMLWNTPESKYECLPLLKDQCVLTMDARIDNRKELSLELILPDRSIDEIGDSEFILAAYTKWGEECPKYLLGDFAFAIWDEKKQQLFCARDHIGIKPFYYYLDDKQFIFCSDIAGILAHPDVPKEYDETTISLFLRDNGMNAFRDTFFDKIKKLPGGTSFIITANKVQEKTYWQIENNPPIHYNTYGEYVDELRSLLESAVEVRLRTAYPVVSHLSGGIDSSPIAVLAARKLKERKQPLHAYNWIDIPEDSEAYETEAYEFSRRIAKLENIEHHELIIDPTETAYWWDRHNMLTKGHIFFLNEQYVQKETAAIGARTILSGWGGDELISFSGYAYIAGLFRQGKWGDALKALYKEQQIRHYSWYRFAKRCIAEMRIPLLYNYLKWKNEKPVEPYESNDYAYVNEKFKNTMKKHRHTSWPDVAGVRNMQKNYFYHGHIQERIDAWTLSAFSKKVEYTYPLLDRRIVEFAFGIPEELFYTPESPHRRLIRNAVADLLPHDIAFFPTPKEFKVYATYQKNNKAILLAWYQKHKDTIKNGHNPYVDEEKIMMALKLFDFNHGNVDRLFKIIPAIMLLSTMRNLKSEITY